MSSTSPSSGQIPTASDRTGARAGWRYDVLPEYAFPRLRRLLDGLTPRLEPINMSIGEPRHGPPAFLGEVLAAHTGQYGRYPPNDGTPEFRAAAHGWLTRRYGLEADMIAPDHQIVPVNGTREALFMAPQTLLPLRGDAPPTERPVILLPNPFYQCYAAAAVAAGAEPVFVDATAETGHLPDFWSVSEAHLERAMALYICSPANPQGTVASRGYWRRLIDLARQWHLTILADECYAEIYDGDPPEGLLQAAAESLPDLYNMLSFHSLSKRSGVPGLRSGFVTGDTRLITRLKKLRSYGGAPLSLPVLAASTALWNDEDHVSASRALYQDKIDLAGDILKGRFGFYRPPGGFFLWLDVSETGLSGEDAAQTLWREAGVMVLPGAYLARDAGNGNPGADYIRVALVHDTDTTGEALNRLYDTL